MYVLSYMKVEMACHVVPPAHLRYCVSNEPVNLSETLLKLTHLWLIDSSSVALHSGNHCRQQGVNLAYELLKPRPHDLSPLAVDPMSILSDLDERCFESTIELHPLERSAFTKYVITTVFESRPRYYVEVIRQLGRRLPPVNSWQRL